MSALTTYLRRHIFNVRTLEQAENRLLYLLQKFRDEHAITRLGFVSGVLTSDGPDMIAFHRHQLIVYTRALCKQINAPVFCCQNVFDEAQEQLFGRNGTSYRDWILFWRRILKSGFITDIYFTPGWRRSTGAVDEYRTAKQNGSQIYEIESSSPGSELLIISAK